MPEAGPDLYVGYLPVPPRLRRFLRIIVPAALWLMVIAAALLARSQRNPGDAVWESTPLTLTGTLISDPYPMLLPDEGDAVLLVEMGKHGARERIAPLDHRHASVTGWPLRRDGRRILELEPNPEAIRIDSKTGPAIPAVQQAGRVTLRGEIVDSKCFLGAMKPGDGKTHKECAMLCITGGIPPVFVTRGLDGRPEYYLLLNQAGGPLATDATPYVADPVEVTGDAETFGGLRRLRLRTADIRRL